MSVRVMSDFELGWVCGLFDGEGTFGVTPEQVVLKLNQIDQDNIERLQRVTGVGSVRPLKKKAEHYKQAWIWQVGNRADVKKLIELMFPHLCARRQVRAMECLAIIQTLDEAAQHRKEVFPQCGHPVEGNHYVNPQKGRQGRVYEVRRCVICTKAKATRWNAMNKERRNQRLQENRSKQGAEA